MKLFMRITICLVALCGLVSTAGAQGIVTTVVGGGPNGIPGTSANLYNPYETAIDSAGNVYVASYSQQRVFKISTSGIITIVAGTGVAGYSGDGGPGSLAQLYSPESVAVDKASPANVYIADYNNCLVRKVNQSTGIITTVAGKVTVPSTGPPYSSCGYTGNGGAANLAALNGPSSVAINPGNNDLYIAEEGNGTVRKVAGGVPTGTISLVAGSGGSPTAGNNCGSTAPYGDGSAATAAYICNPVGVSLDTTANPVNVFISEYNRCDIREVVGSSGDIYQVAGSYKLGCGFTDNVVATSGQFNQVYQTAISVNSGTTTVTAADYANGRVRQFTLTYASGVPKPGNITTIAGKGQGGFCGDGGSPLNACMNPVGVSFDSAGDYYIGDYGADRVRKVTKSTSTISTVAGWGPNGGTQVSYSDPIGILNDVGFPALYYPTGVYADPTSSKVYVGGYQGEAVYVWNSANKEVSDFAGSGVAGFGGDGGLAASVGTLLYYPSGIAKDSNGNVYIADYENCVIREVTTDGNITTVAGGSAGSRNGCGYTGDSGPAVAATFSSPYSLAIDGSNNIYVADYSNCAIRRIDGSTKIVTSIVGGLGCGYAGDNGPASKAKIYNPAQVTLDGAGNIYIADYQNQRIREIVKQTGNIITVAGNGIAGYNGDGEATASSLYYPDGVTSDANGNLFLSDNDNYIVRWVTPTNQMITIGGTPRTAGFSGDGGPALSAEFYQPQQLSQDSAGNIYVADYQNQRIRQISAFPGYGLSTSKLSFETQAAGTTSNFQAITVSAIGPTTFSSVKVTGGFSEVDDCANAGTFTAGQTCEIDVYFTPTAAGDVTGTLTINSNAYLPGNPNTVALSGTASGLKLVGTLNYYTIPLNHPSYKIFTLVNSGPAVTIKKIYLAAPSSFYFGSNGTCPRSGGTLAANSSCTIPLNFSPHNEGGQSITLAIISSDPASPLLASAFGIGTEILPSTNAINFGTIKSGTSTVQNLTITNTGNITFTLNPVITGAGFAFGSTGRTCGGTVAGGASCVLPIEYAPTATGTNTGSVKLNTTNAGSSPTVTLTGTAN